MNTFHVYVDLPFTLTDGLVEEIHEIKNFHASIVQHDRPHDKQPFIITIDGPISDARNAIVSVFKRHTNNKIVAEPADKHVS